MFISGMLLALAAATAPLGVVADTVVPVTRGTRLHVESQRGAVVVSTWDRDAVRVRGLERRDRGRPELSRIGSALQVRPGSRTGAPRDAEIEITAPGWMDVRVEGNQVDVTVRGAGGAVEVVTVAGDVLVEGGTGPVSVRAIQGEVLIRDVRGRVEAVSVNEDIRVSDVVGELAVETTNGDITLRGIRSGDARAKTVNGDVSYQGTLQDRGRYIFGSHNGDVTLTVPGGSNAAVTVSTYHGDFESDFPVRLTGATRDRQFNFTLGSGSARVDLESFNGEVRLRRP